MNAQTPAVPATPAMANTLSLSDLLSVATILGGQVGQAKDSQIKFLMKVAEGGYYNGINLDANKHGQDVDDAVKLAEAYVKAQNSAVMFDAKAPNQQKLTSLVRTSIRFGQWPHGGVGEPIAVMNDFISYRQKVRAKPDMSGKLKDAADAFMTFARNQLKRQTVIDKGEFAQFLFKPGHSLATAEEIIEQARKNLQRLKEGKAAKSTALDQSPEISKAIDALTKRLKDIASARGTAQGNGAPAQPAQPAAA